MYQKRMEKWVKNIRDYHNINFNNVILHKKKLVTFLKKTYIHV